MTLCDQAQDPAPPTATRPVAGPIGTLRTTRHFEGPISMNL